MYTHWLNVYDQQKERENQKMLWKMRENTRCVFFILSTSRKEIKEKNRMGLGDSRQQVYLQDPERTWGRYHLAWVDITVLSFVYLWSEL